MITILHGENIVASRNHLQKIKDEFEGEIVFVDAKGLTETDFIQLTQSNALFDQKRLVVIEGMVDFDLTNVSSDLVIWADKKVTPPKEAKSLEFKVSQTIWQFVDHPNVALFRQALKDNDVQFIFLMLVRKYRLSGDTQKLKQLLELDYQFKTGQLATDLSTAIELFLLGI